MIAALTFTHPWVLLALCAPVLLTIWTWRRRGRNVVLPFDGTRPPRGRGLHLLLATAATMQQLLAAVAVVILAGPQQTGEPKLKRALTNIQFCVDVSGSMNASLGAGTRYDASMAAIDKFLDFRQGDAFGLTFFGNRFLHWVPLTNDPSAVRCAPPFMAPSVAPPWMGGTEIGRALQGCRDVLTARQDGDRMVILISDGQSSDLSNGQDMEIAMQLRKDRIVVYTIHVAEGEIPGEVLNIAMLTGGEAFKADDPEVLKAVFRRIDAMQQTKLEKSVAETMDNFQPWCLAALALAAVCALCAYGLRYNPW